MPMDPNELANLDLPSGEDLEITAQVLRGELFPADYQTVLLRAALFLDLLAPQMDALKQFLPMVAASGGMIPGMGTNQPGGPHNG